jgi:predicted NBD/HSP70 family sugar kinase
MRPIDPPAMRRLNKTSVLRCIRDHGPVSRIQVSNLTGLNKATVSSLVDELITEHLVREAGIGRSSGGRKPILVAFNARAGFSIGVDLQITHVTTTLCDLAGEVVTARGRRITGPELSPEGVLQVLVDEIRAAVDTAPPSPKGVLGVGVAVPGMVDIRSGWVYQLPNLPVTDWPLGPRLAEAVGLPVWVDNDANCGAYAEIRLRSGIRHLVYVHAGVGVGAGIVIDGQLYRGRRGVAGEWGHVPLVERGFACACGGFGCWEQYASEQALVRYLAESGIQGVEWKATNDFVQTVVAQADAGLPAYRRALALLGHHLGLGIASVVNALDPELVLMGGRLRIACHHLLPEVRAVLQHRVVGPAKDVPVELGHPNGVAIGAAALAAQDDVLLQPVDSNE